VELLAVRSGYRLVVEDLLLADAMTAVARGQLAYDELAGWFKARLQPVDGPNHKANKRGGGLSPWRAPPPQGDRSVGSLKATAPVA